MKKRLALGVGSILLVILGIIAFVPSCRLVVLGRLKGERCYRGLPVSYWLYSLESYGDYAQAVEALKAIGPDAIRSIISLLAETEALDSNGGDVIKDRIEHDLRSFGLNKAADERASKVSRRREILVGALREFGKDAIPVLLDSLKSDDREIASTAARALARLGADAVPAIVLALQDDSCKVRRGAAYALALMGREAKGTDAFLIAAMGDADVSVRQWAVYALSRIDPDVEKAVPALVKGLTDQDPQVQRFSVKALGDIGPKAKLAVPVLTDMLHHKGEGLDTLAAEALERIDPEKKNMAGIDFKR